MSALPSDVFGITRALVGFLRLFNLLTGVLLICALPASVLFEPQFVAFFSKQPPRIDPSWLMPALRIWVVLALPMVVAVHIALTRLREVIESVRCGDPFVAGNAVRLKTIAWCSLAAQTLHLVFGILAAVMNAAGSNVEWAFSLNGWLAVLLLFVLARVFEVGARMREDLETMI